MKKASLAAIATLALVSTSVFAELSKAELAGYSGSDQSHKRLASLSNERYTTDIVIVNSSASLITTTVPGTIVRETKPAEENGYIRHPSVVANTHISILDPSGVSFWDGYVCRLAIISVHGVPDAYRITVDQEHCKHVY